MIKKIIYSIVSLVLVSCSSDSVEAQVIHNVSVVEFDKLIKSDEGIVLDVRTIDEVMKGILKMQQILIFMRLTLLLNWT